MEKWFEAHKFPYIKKEDGTYFWQTTVATGEITPEGKINWYDKNYFEKVKYLGKYTDEEAEIMKLDTY